MPLTRDTRKVCTECNASKTLDKFWKQKQGAFGRGSKCSECLIAVNRQKREADPEKYKAYRQAYLEKHGEKMNAQSREWHRVNNERSCAQKKAYYQANKERHAARGRAYAEKHKERLRALAKLKKRNPELDRVNCAKRRARKLGAGGHHTAADVKALYSRQKAKCAVCKTNISSGYHADHRMPLSKGGSNDIKNIDLLCPPCNLTKKAKLPEDFMRERGFLL